MWIREPLMWSDRNVGNFGLSKPSVKKIECKDITDKLDKTSGGSWKVNC